MTLTLDFQGQILKMLYLRNGRADWHGTKGMWVDRILDPHCDFELWQRLRNYVGTSAFTDVDLWSPMSCPVTSDFLADVILEHNLGCHNDNDQ